MAMDDGSFPGEDVGFLGQMVFRRIRQGITDALTRYDSDDLRNYVLTEYNVVENELPDRARAALENNGQQYEHLIRDHLHPENVYDWVSNPQWAPTDDAREELRECAETLESTPGADEWLTEQVYTVWVIAGIDPPADVDLGED